MNKKLTIAIVVILLVILGGGGFYVFSKRNNGLQQTFDPGIQEEKTTPQTAKSLKELLTSGTAQKCTFSDTTEGVTSQGTSYIADGKVRADFTTTAEGNTTTGHMIFDGTTSFVWMDGSATGFKMAIDPNEVIEDETSDNGSDGIDLNKTLDYQCGSWSKDAGMFTPPGNVQFSEFTIPTIPAGGSTNGNSALCSTCDNLTGDQKTQCLTVLNCE